MLYQKNRRKFISYLVCATRAGIKNLAYFNSSICDATKEQSLRPEWKKGRVLTLLESKMVEMKKGKKYGSLSAIFMQESKDVLPLISCTPIEAIFSSGDIDTRYLQARFGLATVDLVQIASSFLSFAAELLRYIENHCRMIVDDIEKGTINSEIRMPDEVRESLTKKNCANARESCRNTRDIQGRF